MPLGDPNVPKKKTHILRLLHRQSDSHCETTTTRGMMRRKTMFPVCWRISIVTMTMAITRTMAVAETMAEV
jgi:hypothetical protein